MSGTVRIRLFGVLAMTIMTVALISRKDQPVVAPQRTTGSHLLLRHRPPDSRTMAPLLSIPGQPNDAGGSTAPTLRIPVIQAAPPRPNGGRLRPSATSLPAYELPTDDGLFD